MKLYTVWDKVARKSFPPFLQENDLSAKRLYEKEIVKNIKVDYMDYELYGIGDFDEKNMKIKSKSPYIIETNIDMVEEK